MEEKKKATKLLLTEVVRTKILLIANSQRRDLTNEIYYIIDLFLDYPNSKEKIEREIEILLNKK